MAVYLIVGRIAGRVRFLVYFLHSEKSGSLPLYNLRDREEWIRPGGRSRDGRGGGGKGVRERKREGDGRGRQGGGRGRARG